MTGSDGRGRLFTTAVRAEPTRSGSDLEARGVGFGRRS